MAQCSMCTKMNLSHPNGCPNMGILCSARGRPNHVAVFCRRIVDKVVNSGEKKYIFPAKGNRNKNYNNKKSNVKRKDRDESD